MSRSGPLVAAAMVVMSVVTYAFNLIAARWLVPEHFGALTALLSVILIANVASLGVQSAVARRIAVDRANSTELISTARRFSPRVSFGVCAVVAGSAFVLTPLLHFDSIWPVVFCGAMMLPLTHMGAQAGVAQGTERWGRLSAIYVANGLGRLLGGLVGMLVSATATGAMAGLAVGAWLPVLAGAGLLNTPKTDRSIRSGPVIREAFLASSTLLAFFALSNLDALLARGLFDEHSSGLYAAGLIMTKSTLFLPQFVSVVFFPSLARDTSNRSRARAVSMVLALGIVATAGVVLLPNLALSLVGGNQYLAMKSNLWWFALSGTALSMVYVLVFDALARRVRGATLLLWATVATITLAAILVQPSTVGLVQLMLAGAVFSTLGLFWLPRASEPDPESRHLGSVAGFEPVDPGADLDVERN